MEREQAEKGRHGEQEEEEALNFFAYMVNVNVFAVGVCGLLWVVYIPVMGELGKRGRRTSALSNT